MNVIAGWINPARVLGAAMSRQAMNPISLEFREIWHGKNVSLGVFCDSCAYFSAQENSTTRLLSCPTDGKLSAQV